MLAWTEGRGVGALQGGQWLLAGCSGARRGQSQLVGRVSPGVTDRVDRTRLDRIVTAL